VNQHEQMGDHRNYNWRNDSPFYRNGFVEQGVNMKLVLLCVIVGLSVSLIGAGEPQSISIAQTSSSVDYSCHQAAVSALRSAVDPDQAEYQEWNLNAAKAFEELQTDGESCN
jgi:hypothetical protein